MDSSRNARRKRSPKPNKRNKQNTTTASSMLNNSNSNINATVNTTTSTTTTAQTTTAGPLEVTPSTDTSLPPTDQVEQQDEEIDKEDVLLATTPVTGLGTVVDIQESFQVSVEDGLGIE